MPNSEIVTDTALSRHGHPIAVESGDIDLMGHVSNANYLNWVQEAVLAHWQKIARPRRGPRISGSRYNEIIYRKPAILDDTVIASAVIEKV